MQERLLQEQICNYLRHAWPDTIFRSDFAAGMRMTIGQAVLHKRMQSTRAYPDLFVAAPRGPYSGLFIELKAEGVTLFLKNGELVANAHIREQAQVLRQLTDEGYKAAFAVGFSEARAMIDDYLGIKKPPQRELAGAGQQKLMEESAA